MQCLYIWFLDRYVLKKWPTKNQTSYSTNYFNTIFQGSLIANMIMGIIILKKSYRLDKYFSVGMITLGIIICTIISGSNVVSKSSSFWFKNNQECWFINFSRWLWIKYFKAPRENFLSWKYFDSKVHCLECIERSMKK